MYILLSYNGNYSLSLSSTDHHHSAMLPRRESNISACRCKITTIDFIAITYRYTLSQLNLFSISHIPPFTLTQFYSQTNIQCITLDYLLSQNTCYSWFTSMHLPLNISFESILYRILIYIYYIINPSCYAMQQVLSLIMQTSNNTFLVYTPPTTLVDIHLAV